MPVFTIDNANQLAETLDIVLNGVDLLKK